MTYSFTLQNSNYAMYPVLFFINILLGLDSSTLNIPYWDFKYKHNLQGLQKCEYKHNLLGLRKCEYKHNLLGLPKV